MSGVSPSLASPDRVLFERFHIPEELLQRAGVVRVTNEEARTSYGMRGPAYADYSGIIFPYYNPDTGTRWTARLRRDNPEIEDGKEKNKYISAWGDKKHFFFPPGTRERLQDPETVIALVEAEKSSLSGEALAQRHGRKLLFVAMGGCWGYKGRIGIKENARGVRVDEKGPISDLDFCNQRTVIVALDSDVSKNKKVREARAELVRELKRRGCEVHILTLPSDGGVNGPDDYIALRGDEQMLKLIDNAYETVAYFDYGGGKFEVDDKGVHYFPAPDKDGQQKKPLWLCAPLEIVAKTRDAKGSAWGRLLEWKDSDENAHSWAMPMELLQRDGGVEARCELAQQGLAISPSKAAKENLATYLQVWPTDSRARCVDRLGWIQSGDKALYILPNQAVGMSNEHVVFQNAHAIEPAFSTSGTIDGWKQSVARLAVGNSRIMFAISSAFAGPTLRLTGEASGGLHLRGISSIGKTTALEGAASVYGDPERYCRRWRATVNGLEGLATLHNDGLLILDELSQVDPKDAGEAAYLLANGQGKTRASRSGLARPTLTWRLIYLSAGEESLSALMARAGRRPTAGQEIRMAEIEADAGKGMGLIEELHEFEAPAQLVLAFHDATKAHHGAVGTEFLARLTDDQKQVVTFLTDGVAKFLKQNVPLNKNGGGQIERVARRFALIGLAGEVASLYKLTGWGKGAALEAAAICFASWLVHFGGGNREEQTLLAQVKEFFELHGASRFEDIAETTNVRIINRAGFYRELADKTRAFMILPNVYRSEVIKGYDPKFANKVLIDHGWLLEGEDAVAQKVRLPELGSARAYVFSSQMWESD
jgi:uncharacterized protein (DUF927 family)